MTAVFSLMDTPRPKPSPKVPSLDVSFASSVQVVPERTNTYAAPLTESWP